MPQVIPAGALVTVPLPVFATVRVAVFRLNFAVHVLLAFMVTEPSEQSVSPVQPENLELAAGIAVSVTETPEL